VVSRGLTTYQLLIDVSPQLALTCVCGNVSGSKKKTQPDKWRAIYQRITTPVCYTPTWCASSESGDCFILVVKYSL